jgi:hypothetical protein
MTKRRAEKGGKISLYKVPFLFYLAAMDWAYAIERNRAPLLVEVLKLFAMIGLAEGVTIERISRPLHRQVLNILRKAESAVRRLIVTAARDIVLEPTEPRTSKPRQKPSAKTDTEAKPRRKRRPLFSLFDTLKRVGHRFKKKKRRGPEPHIHSFPAPEPRIPEFLRSPAPPPPPVAEKKIDDGMVSARNLVRRLVAVLDAVQDIQGHAMRLARWEAKPKEERRPERWSPLRPGRPPGFRQRNIHVVDEILKECDWLAKLGNPPLDDTS